MHRPGKRASRPRPPRPPGPAIRFLVHGCLTGCAAALAGGCRGAERERPPLLEVSEAPASVDETARVTCDTPPELVDGLSRQLVDAINCLRPGTLVELPLGAQIQMLEPGRPNLIDGRGLADLVAAAREGDRTLVVRWAYRDVGLQQLFWLQDQYQGCAVAARPGRSNHQNGLAVDLNDREYWEPIMRRHGWENNLDNDRVHFDYQRAEDLGLGSLSLYAFQELWNLNHPEGPVPTSGELDAATDTALAAAPLEGLALELCENGAPPGGPGGIGLVVGQAAWRDCAPPAALRLGLSAQLVRTMNCLSPGALVPLPVCPGVGCVSLAEAAAPALLVPEAVTALVAASRAHGRRIDLRWAFRDVALEHLLALSADRIGCPAFPGAGRSVLNTGLGVETVDGTADAVLAAAGFETEAAEGGRFHRLAGDEQTALNVLAFQRLWNLNRPDDLLEEDGRIGPMTRNGLERAPVQGFDLEPCPPDSIEAPDAGAGGGLVPADAGAGVGGGSSAEGGSGGDGGHAAGGGSAGAGDLGGGSETLGDAGGGPEGQGGRPGGGPSGLGGDDSAGAQAGGGMTPDAAVGVSDAGLQAAPRAGFTGASGCRASGGTAAGWLGIVMLGGVLRRRRRG